MSAELKPDSHLEIGHVLFIDVVGYSKLTGEEQKRVIHELNEIVRGTREFRQAEADGTLVRLPSGDGMALVFFTSPDAPVQCAVEIGQALPKYPHIKVRMGINSGPVDRVADVNEQSNVSGVGINTAERVMSCGDAGHILLTKRVADDLANYGTWRPHLRDLGEVEVKHGVRIGIVNLCVNGAGNPSVPDKLQRQKRQRLNRWILIGLAIVVTLVLALFVTYWQKKPGRQRDKSIAVLPFENLSANPENAFFADGVQDEILTYLGKIADLKVISRISVMQYKPGVSRKAGAIAESLGVSHLLEGSVQRIDGKVRVNAQLIDARKDAHVWAQTYDRDLADVFAIQSEIAKTIADQLQAKLSPEERSQLGRPPTSDDEAFALYTQAKTLLIRAVAADPEKETFLHAVDLLNRAVARDPSFSLAYCQLVHAHAEIYFYDFDHTETRKALADAALQAAVRLRPDAGETHLAQAEYLYRCLRKYDRARAELALAARALPNSSRVYELGGYIDRRQGRWAEASQNLEKALELDPQNVVILGQIANLYPFLRRFRDEAAAMDRLLAIAPKDQGFRVSRAFIEVDRAANLEPYREAVRAILSEHPDNKEEIASDWFDLSWFDRNAAEATDAAAAMPASGGGRNAVRYPRAWYEGLAARLGGNAQAAHDAFLQARIAAQRAMQERPEFGPALSVLGLIDAMLGRADDATREGCRAVELLPIEQDSINGSHLLLNLAIIYATTGQKDLAIDTIDLLLRRPGDGSYGEFKLNPFWDPLRGDPRFEALLASLAPKG